MGSRRIRTLVVTLAVAGKAWGTAAQAVVAPQWNHDPADAARGPLSWAQIDATFEACGAGRSQSPVDVGTTRKAKLPVLRFHYPRVPLTVENTGHVVEVPIPADSGATLRVGTTRTGSCSSTSTRRASTRSTDACTTWRRTWSTGTRPGGSPSSACSGTRPRTPTPWSTSTTRRAAAR